MALEPNNDLLNYSTTRATAFLRHYSLNSILLQQSAFRTADSIWRSLPWTPTPLPATSENKHIAEWGPWSIIDNPAIINDHWTAGDWYLGNTSYDGTGPGNLTSLTTTQIRQRLRIFGLAYYIHVQYLTTNRNLRFGVAFRSTDRGEPIYTDDILASEQMLPKPAYTLLSNHNLLQGPQPTPLFSP